MPQTPHYYHPATILFPPPLPPNSKSCMKNCAYFIQPLLMSADSLKKWTLPPNNSRRKTSSEKKMAAVASDRRNTVLWECWHQYKWNEPLWNHKCTMWYFNEKAIVKNTSIPTAMYWITTESLHVRFPRKSHCKNIGIPTVMYSSEAFKEELTVWMLHHFYENLRNSS